MEKPKGANAVLLKIDELLGKVATGEVDPSMSPMLLNLLPYTGQIIALSCYFNPSLASSRAPRSKPAEKPEEAAKEEIPEPIVDERPASIQEMVLTDK